MTAPTLPPIVAPITEDDIAQFLLRTPDFFERHAQVLASVQIASPHGARAVSLQERQAEMLREKIKGLEQRIMEMVRNSTDNAAIAHKLHQWSAALLQIEDRSGLPQAVVDGLRTLFDIPQAALRLWGLEGLEGLDGLGEHGIDARFSQGASDDARALASSLTMPFCGPNLGFEPALWLAQQAGDPAASLALLPLREGAVDSASPAFGLLVLGSPDPQRFDAAMGTDFLARIAELASAALLRLR
ncbi:DUF484 family protein [Verminephrobacter eiseniae]|uniref:DUF484 family protein n=1 Tax=Verminephrobacter eiseniae TaxID=364317 RepID=UPI0022381F27|nr:DUF484 family protein [Verminephrobacter eiseniae]MCW5238707.1 DUF484 family protein [Verminephrobacter eiseniae]